MAQANNVTMYGVVDLYAGQAKSGPTSQFRLNDGGNIASQLGFKGTEDLGGGLSAIFQIEGGLNADDGSGTLPGPSYSFTRQAYAGLTSTSWGEITAGRMYTPHFVSMYKASPLGMNAIFSPNILVYQVDGQTGLTGNASRSNNTIRYRTPAAWKFGADFAYAPGEANTPSTSSGNIMSFALSWTDGPLYVGYGHLQVKSGSAAAPVASPTTSTHQTLSASYDFKVLKLTGHIGQDKSDQSTVPSAKFLGLGAAVPLGPVMGLFEIMRRDVANTSRDNLAYTIGADYPLSKRTSVYARYLHLSNKGGASVSLGGVPVVANSGDSVSLFGFGITHKF
jgi:predicted porin